MSTEVTRSLTLSSRNSSTYLTKSGSVTVGGNFAGIYSVACILAVLTLGNSGDAILNNTAKNVLFPNNTAHPIRLTGSYYAVATGSGTISMSVDDVKIDESSPPSDITERPLNISTPTILAMTKSSKISWHMARTSSLTIIGITGSGASATDTFTISLVFTRYDFSAVGMPGVTASVSSANGYDGDSITWTADVQSGYTFDGWYADAACTQLVSTARSYTETVSGADRTLYAKVTAPATKTLTVSYSGRSILTDTISGDAAVSYDGAQLFSLGYGTKTLLCAGKVMRGDVSVGGKTLNCAGKLMQGDVTVSVTQGGRQ